MVISLIGMSGSGKSHWSSLLSRSGFTRYCCDDLITERLSSELRRADGTALTLGEWMGFPYDDGYPEKEAKYLARENEVVAEVLGGIERHAPAVNPEKTVVDTTGSVIYTGRELLERLKSLTLVIHFASPPEARQEMLRAYMAKPRPILWRGLFNPEPGESRQEALRRCYEDLLESRELLYRELADVIIDYETRRNPDFGITDFLALAESAR
ncbi:MAG: hypothetical protein ABFD97_07340 [Syntrophobacter sp.]